MVVIERQGRSAVRKDRVYNNLTTTNVSKIPIWDSLSAVGDESGMAGDIIIDKSSSSFCFHNGIEWLCVLGSSGGGNSPWTVVTPNFIQNVAYPDAPVSFGGNNLLFGSAVLDSTQGANGTRMLFIADGTTPTAGIGAIRAGTTSGPEWDAVNRGDNSVAFGVDNVASGARAFIGSGKYNTASGLDTVVCGGVLNSATGQNAVIVGGVANSASGKFSGILSGGRYLNAPPYTLYGNIVTGNYSCIGAGYANTVSGAYQQGTASIIGGGIKNFNNATHAFIGAGSSNILTYGLQSSIVGGFKNSINNSRNFIGGGDFNTIDGANVALVGGSRNTIRGDSCFIGSGAYNTISQNSSAIVSGTQNSVSNLYCFIGAGLNNTVTNRHAAIMSGTLNTASAKYSVIGGGANNYTFQGITDTYGYSFIGAGFNNTASERTVFIGAGQFNTATAQESFIGGGGGNIANAKHATIVGGFQNSASGTYTFIGSGKNNIVSNELSVIVGGESNTVSAAYSGILAGMNNVIDNGISSDTVNSSITAGNNLQLDQRDTTMTQNLRVGDIAKSLLLTIPTGGVQLQSTRIFDIPAVMPNIHQLTFEDHTAIIFATDPNADITIYLPDNPIQGQRYYVIFIKGLNNDGILASMSNNIYNTFNDVLSSTFDLSIKRGVTVIYTTGINAGIWIVF